VDTLEATKKLKKQEEINQSLLRQLEAVKSEYDCLKGYYTNYIRGLDKKIEGQTVLRKKLTAEFSYQIERERKEALKNRNKYLIIICLISLANFLIGLVF